MEINKKPMVDILSEMIGEQVVMDGNGYVTISGAKVSDSLVLDAELKQSELYEASLVEQAKAEAQAYLDDTDWVEPYLIKHYTGIELLPIDSNKFVIEQKRKEAKELLK